MRDDLVNGIELSIYGRYVLGGTRDTRATVAHATRVRQQNGGLVYF